MKTENNIIELFLDMVKPNQKTKDIIIDKFNEKINEYVEKHNLFCGGCCYSAYVLAKNLTELGINYKIVMFQYHEVLHANNFDDAINGAGVAHVAIEVIHHRKRFIIGDCGDLDNYFKNVIREKYTVKRYSGITPEMLLKGYKDQTHWNWVYNAQKYNKPLYEDIEKITKKYSRQYFAEMK